jgi:hypothetical protein
MIVAEGKSKVIAACLLKQGRGSNSAATRNLKQGRELRFGEGGAGREETSGGL